MNNKKRLLAIFVAVIMLCSTVAVLAACNPDRDGENNTATFDINWNNYLTSFEELYGDNGSKLPTATTVDFGDASILPYYSDASKGLIVLSEDGKVYGYSIAGNIFFANDVSHVSLSADSTYPVYQGYTEAEQYILYDFLGNFLTLSGTRITNMSYVTGYYNGEELTLFAVETSDGTTYIEVLEDGTFGRHFNFLPEKGTTAGTGEGEYFGSIYKTLDEWLGVDEEETDEFLQTTRVYEQGRTVKFEYEVGDLGWSYAYWERPLNLDQYVYLNKTIIYSTLTPIDTMLTSGYNYVDANGNKFNGKMFKFDIEANETTQLNVDYLLTDYSNEMYNKTDKVHDLAFVGVYRLIDGVAWTNAVYADFIVINSDGAIGFSYQTDRYGFPTTKLGNNILTSSGYIVDRNNQVLANVGSLSSSTLLVPNGFVHIYQGKVGVIGYDGKVKVSFVYNLSSLNNIYGNYALVTDNSGKQYSLNLVTGNATTLTAISKVDEANTYVQSIYYGLGQAIRAYDEENGTYNWYTLDGKTIVSNTTASTLAVSVFSRGETTCGWVSVTVKTEVGTQTQYIRLTF